MDILERKGCNEQKWQRDKNAIHNTCAQPPVEVGVNGRDEAQDYEKKHSEYYRVKKRLPVKEP
jgi:hypothetical protein